MLRQVWQALTIETLAEELLSTQRGMQHNNVPTLLARSVAQGERASNFREEVAESFVSTTEVCHLASGRETHLN